MQFFIFIVVENSILGNPYSDHLEIYWFNVLRQPENAGHSKNLSLFDKKQAQTELTNV